MTDGPVPRTIPRPASRRSPRGLPVPPARRPASVSRVSRANRVDRVDRVDAVVRARDILPAEGLDRVERRRRSATRPPSDAHYFLAEETAPRARPDDGRRLRPVPDRGRGSARFSSPPIRSAEEAEAGLPAASAGISSPKASSRLRRASSRSSRPATGPAAARTGPVLDRRPGGAGPDVLRRPARPGRRKGRRRPKIPLIPSPEPGRRPAGGHRA
ncbi:MAG: hypothetical protein MZV64_63210 [Ignavibacteriales bacterium]|nr:hypothetical protein [Ignavibacteriales bacterium]